MTPDDLRAIMAHLRERVRVEPRDAETPISIAFDGPREAEMLAAGLDAEGVGRILRVPWRDEMVADIVETPDQCDPDDPPEQILEYARTSSPSTSASASRSTASSTGGDQASSRHPSPGPPPAGEATGSVPCFKALVARLDRGGSPKPRAT